MDDKDLQQKLNDLHAEIERVQDVDDEARQMLTHLQQDIENLLEGSSDAEGHQSLIERLNEAINQFEVTHPDMTKSMGQLLDLLARLGI
jgi:chromosome segregation ATPase